MTRSRSKARLKTEKEVAAQILYGGRSRKVPPRIEEESSMSSAEFLEKWRSVCREAGSRQERYVEVTTGDLLALTVLAELGARSTEACDWRIIIRADSVNLSAERKVTKP